MSKRESCDLAKMIHNNFGSVLMDIVNLINDAVIEASTTFRNDQLDAYKRALEMETSENASWMLELFIKMQK